MLEKVITATEGEILFVTVLRQFALPVSIHVDTIRQAVRYIPGGINLSLHLHGFHGQVMRWDFADLRGAREHLVGRMIDWLQQYGVHVETDSEGEA